MANVKTVFVSDDKELSGAISKLNKQMEALIAKNQQLAAASAKGTQQTQDGMVKLGDSIKGAIGSYLSLQAAIQLVNAELQSQIELERKVRDTQKQASSGERGFLLNLGLVSSTERDKALKQLEKISQERRVPITSLYEPASSALSASGGDTDRAMAAIASAAKIAPDDPATMDQLASAMLHLQKATGSTDADKNLALLIGLGAVSPVKDWSKLAENLTPGIIGVQGFGGTAEEAGALLATLANQMGDVRGDQAKTEGINLAKQLEAFLPAEDVYETDEKGRRRLKTKGTGLATTEERIRFLQEHEQEREAYLAKASIGAQAVIPVRRILSGDETAKEFYAEAKKGLQEATSSSSIVDEFSKVVDATMLQQAGGEERALSQATEQAKLLNDAAARRDRFREAIDETLQNAGVNTLDRAAARWKFTLSPRERDPRDVAEEILRDELLPRQFDERRWPGQNPERAREIQVLENMLSTILKMSHDEQQKQTQLLEQLVRDRKSEPTTHLPRR